MKLIWVLTGRKSPKIHFLVIWLSLFYEEVDAQEHLGTVKFHIVIDVSVTPAKYEPPGFMAAEKDNFAFGDEPMTLNVGDVATVSAWRSN